MVTSKPYLQHLNSSKSLETSYEAVRAGFVALALEKNRRATPFVAQARALKSAVRKIKVASDLLNIPEIQSALLLAAGVSDKAANHLQTSDKRDAIDGLIKNFLEPAGAKFTEELVFRFLLTRGDTLGGSMRNVGGFLAQVKFTRSLVAHLSISGQKCRWLHNKNKEWIELSKDDVDVELSLKGLSWIGGNGPRTLLYNISVPLTGSNVDLVLFNCAAQDFYAEALNNPLSYIALGELKGGIDPAGADEHWKTARTAFNRIHKAFANEKITPHTFYVGAAIEKKMATEIWDMLNRSVLENAANLTNDDQLASISEWLCSI